MQDLLSSGYVVSPRKIVKQLGWKCAFIYQFLCYYAAWESGYKTQWERGQVVTNVASICKATSWNKNLVYKVIDQLVDSGLISKSNIGNKRGTLFTIHHYDDLSKNHSRNKPEINQKQTRNKPEINQNIIINK